MKKLIKEPLIHFLLLGLLIFAIYAVAGDDQVSENTIVFDTYDLDNVLSTWDLQWKRPPTPEELSNLINQKIKQELFYKEALSLNLDHNDEIIKRRLSQKMQFLSNDLAQIKSPTDAELKAYFNEHIDTYLLPHKYSFYQIVFSPDRRDNPRADAEAVLKNSGEVNFQIMQTKGDRLPFKYKYENSNTTELKALFGRQFADGLAELPIGKWVGPVRSGFGYHLVYIENKVNPRAPELNTVAEKVINDYTYDQQQKMDRLIFEELKKKYSIEFDLDEELVDAETRRAVTNALN